MKRMLAIAVALVAFGFTALPAKAEEPVKKFYLNDDGSVTLRIEAVEGQVRDLEKRVTALEEKSKLPPLRSTVTAETKAAKPIVNPLTPKESAPTAPVQFKTVRVQTCTNGVCRVEYVQVPIDDATAASVGVGNPCPMGQCTDCQCAAMSGTTSTTRTGWYLGKRLGR